MSPAATGGWAVPKMFPFKSFGFPLKRVTCRLSVNVVPVLASLVGFQGHRLLQQLLDQRRPELRLRLLHELDGFDELLHCGAKLSAAMSDPTYARTHLHLSQTKMSDEPMITAHK